MGRHLMVERVAKGEFPREQEAGGREHPNLSSVPSIQGCFQLRHNLEAVVEDGGEVRGGLAGAEEFILDNDCADAWVRRKGWGRGGWESQRGGREACGAEVLAVGGDDAAILGNVHLWVGGGQVRVPAGKGGAPGETAGWR